MLLKHSTQQPQLKKGENYFVSQIQKFQFMIITQPIRQPQDNEKIWAKESGFHVGDQEADRGRI